MTLNEIAAFDVFDGFKEANRTSHSISVQLTQLQTESFPTSA